MAPAIANGSTANSKAISRKLAFGVLGNFLSKISGAGIQLFAIPVAIKILGVDNYVAYATLLAIAAWPVLFLINFGPRLVANISACDTVETQSNIFQRSVRVLLLNVLFVLIGIGVFFTCFRIDLLFPKLQELGPGQAGRLAFALSVVNVISSLFAIPEAFQMGFQKFYLINAVTLIGNVVSLFLIVVFLPIVPRLETLLISLTLPIFVGRLTNASLFLVKHQYLFTNFEYGFRNWYLSDSQVRQGVAFTLITGIASYICNQLPLLLLSKFASNTQAAIYSSLLTILGMLMQPVALLIAPLIPALSRSIASGEVLWVKKTLQQLAAVVISYGVIVLIVLPIIGPTVYSRWSISLHASSVLFLCVATYLFSICAENCLFWLCHVIGSLRTCYSLYILRTIATALTALGLAFGLSLEMYFAIISCTTLGIMVLPLCAKTWSYLHNLSFTNANSKIESV